jgi:uncharacterized protein with PhoU and TrkA domain
MRKRGGKNTVIYDVETDGHIEQGDILLIRQDGMRELVRKTIKREVKANDNGQPDGIDYNKIKPSGQIILV